MTSLEDTFGEEFAKDLNQQIAKRRERRYRVDDETKNLIAHMAINEEKFHGGEPHFSVKDDEGITHDVLLMDVPNPQSKSFFSMIRQLDSGAVTAPLNYLGEFMSTLWNDPDLVKELEPGENYVVVGELDQWENDKGEVQDQLQPVRGVIGLEELQKRAAVYLDEEADGVNTEDGEDSPEVVQETSPDPDVQEPEEEEPDTEPPEPDQVEEEPEEEERKPRFKAPRRDDDKKEVEEDEEPEPEEEEDDLDEDSVLAELAGEEESEPEPDDAAQARGISEDQVAAHIESLANKEPKVWEVEEGDPRLDKLAGVVTKRLDLDTEDSAVVEEVKNLCLKRIEEERVSASEADGGTDEEDDLF